MHRWIAVLMLLVMLPWQAMGWAASTLTGESEHAAHAVAHWSGESHHHDAHDDGFHTDDSDESIRHVVQVDAHLNEVALPSFAVDWAFPAPFAAVPDGRPAKRLSCPFVDGPRRPPRSSC